MSTCGRGDIVKTIAIISQKGGAGKTTLSVHLATAAALAGHNAAIIDLDPQGTAASWGDRRQADAPEVVSGQAARLSILIEAARTNGAAFLVLDTAPNADQTALRAAQTADLVLIPCRAATLRPGASNGRISPTGIWNGTGMRRRSTTAALRRRESTARRGCIWVTPRSRWTGAGRRATAWTRCARSSSATRAAAHRGHCHAAAGAQAANHGRVRAGGSATYEGLAGILPH